MNVGQLVICKREAWIAFNRLVQQANGFGQALRLRCAKNSSRDERFGPYVQIVRNKVSRRFLLDGRFLLRRELGFELINDLLSNLTLNREHVCKVAVISLCP